MNHFNTDYTKKPQTDEQLALQELHRFKPVQHPRNLHSEDSAVIEHQVPAKNLTPYYQIPTRAFVEQDAVFQDSPLGARSLEVCLLGAPNAGKSSLMNTIVGKNVSAVSDKYNTTDESVRGIYTDFGERTQLVFLDTPGVTKMNNSMRSNLLISKAWHEIPSQDMAIFVVDSVRRLSLDVKGAIVRLSNTKVDPSDQKINQSMKEGTFTDERLERGDYEMTEEEKRLHSYHIPSVLVMNKVDLVTSKRRLKTL